MFAKTKNLMNTKNFYEKKIYEKKKVAQKNLAEQKFLPTVNFHQRKKLAEKISDKKILEKKIR